MSAPDPPTEPTLDPRPRVLVVEDDPDVRLLIVTTLGDQVRCLEAEDGAEGLYLALRTRPDVIVVDVMMPTMSGDNLALTLQDIPTLAKVPILVLTALTDGALRERLLAVGVDAYVTKPFDLEELRSLVLDLAAGHRG